MKFSHDGTRFGGVYMDWKALAAVAQEDKNKADTNFAERDIESVYVEIVA